MWHWTEKEAKTTLSTEEQIQDIVLKTVSASLQRYQPVSVATAGRTTVSVNPEQEAAYPFKPFSFEHRKLDNSLPVTPSTKETMELSAPQGSPALAIQPNMMTREQILSYDTNHFVMNVPQLHVQGGPMVDLSEYKDLTQPPESALSGVSTLNPDVHKIDMESPAMNASASAYKAPSYAMHPEMQDMELDQYADYSGNVKILVQLVNDLPEGVTKQMGAQIIRLTMEAMGMSMENVLSEAQSAQSEMLDAVRSNIKKIEEFKTEIRKLETKIRYHQGRANQLSEIIDLFIMSNTSPNIPQMEQPAYS